MQTSPSRSFFYVAFYAFDTIANVPYSALGPELSELSSERDSLFFWAKLINGVGILLAAVSPVLVTVAFRSCGEWCVSCSPSLFFSLPLSPFPFTRMCLFVMQ